jgi:hypothetical protein
LGYYQKIKPMSQGYIRWKRGTTKRIDGYDQ